MGSIRTRSIPETLHTLFPFGYTEYFIIYKSFLIHFAVKIMWTQIIGSILLITVAHAQVDCRNKPDGVYGWGCRSFTRCEGGRGQQVDCFPPNGVFNPDIGGCDRAENVDPPCGLRRDCTGLENGRHADLLLNCTSYYTCLEGTYFGHNPCSAGLVFDERIDTCNWAYAVPPPCGTCTSCASPLDPATLEFWSKKWKAMKAQEKLKSGKKIL